MPVHALPYIGIRVEALFSLLFIHKIYAQVSLDPPENLGEGDIEEFGPFSIFLWVFIFDFVCKDCFK